MVFFASVKTKCPFIFQIKEKLLQLTDKRKDMIDKWEDRWEWLRLGNSIKSCSVCCTVLATV